MAKTKRIAFFMAKQIIFKLPLEKKKKKKMDFLTFFLIFFVRIWLDWKALVKPCIYSIKKKEDFFPEIFFSQKFRIKKKYFWDFLKYKDSKIGYGLFLHALQPAKRSSASFMGAILKEYVVPVRLRFSYEKSNFLVRMTKWQVTT